MPGMPGSSKAMDELAAEVQGWKTVEALLTAVRGAEDATLIHAVLATIREAKSRRDADANEHVRNEQSDGRDNGAASVGEAFWSGGPVSLVAPRARLDASASRDALRFSGPKQSLIVPVRDFDAVAVLDRIANDTAGKVYVLLALRPGAEATYGKQTLRNVLIQTLPNETLPAANVGPDGALPAPKQASIVFCELLATLGVPGDRFLGPDPRIFRPASGKNSLPCSYARGGIKEGQLFLLPGAVCFVPTPPTLLRLTSVRCIELPRHGTASRTFDVRVYDHEGTMHDFMNVGAEHAAAVAGWAAAGKVALGAPPESGDESEGSGEGGEGGEGHGGSGDSEGSSYDEDADSDFDAMAEEEREMAAERRRRERKRRRAGGEGGGGEGGEGAGEGEGETSSEEVGSFEMVSEEGIKAGAVWKEDGDEVEGPSAGPSGAGHTVGGGSGAGQGNDEGSSDEDAFMMR